MARIKKSVSFLVKSLCVFCAFFVSAFNICFGADNVLNSVELSQKDGVYELKLKTDAPAAYVKKVESKDSVYFDLKNVNTSEKIDTVYNDVSDIDGVVIQQIDKTKLRIYVNGLNSPNTKVVFETPALVQQETKEIVINRPIREYAPITGEEKYEEKADWENNGFNADHLLGSIIKKITGSEVDWALILSIIVVVASIVGLKKAFSKVRIDQEPLIGISPNNKKIFEDLAAESANPNSQQELIEKLNEHNNRYQARPAAETPQKRPVNTAMESYALNSYQKMQNTNPYAQNARTANTGVPRNAFTSGSTISQPQRRHLPVGEPASHTEPGPRRGIVNPQQASKKAFTTNVVKPLPQAQFSKEEQAGPAKRNIENIKFLESVTKIYEQSGRKDLANGLKANLSRNKMVV